MTLGTASVEDVVDLPESAPLRLDAVPVRHGTVLRASPPRGAARVVSRLRSALGRGVGRGVGRRR